MPKRLNHILGAPIGLIGGTWFVIYGAIISSWYITNIVWIILGICFWFLGFYSLHGLIKK